MKSVDQKRPLKVFLCHAHADRDPVRALYTRLTNDGVDAWLDKEKLLGGQNWRMEIRAAVEEADVVVVCHSKEFNKEGFRQREVKWALDAAMEKPEGTIFIIPARLEECEVIKSLSDWHWVDLFEDDGYERLMRALRARANNIGATLQIKKGWLPKINSPLPKKQKTIETKTNDVSEKNILKTVEKKSQSPELPDEWEAQWQAAFVKKATEEKVTTEVADINIGIPSSEKKQIIRKPNIAIVVAVIGAIVLIVIGLLNLPLIEKRFFLAPVEAETATVTLVLTPKPITSSRTPETIQPSKTLTKIVTPTKKVIPTSTFEVTSTPIGKDGMALLYVPAGDFTMGTGGSLNYPNEVKHTVYLDAFWIDKTEVTNKMYALCVADGACQEPGNTSSSTSLSYYGDPQYDNYPVIYVNWYKAKTYCEWADRQLPTEAQWEKAARRTNSVSSYDYPWDGYSENYCSFTNYSTCVGDTTEVGKYTKGASPYGALDMAGNVWEWVADWYSATYYSDSPESNPLGPSSGEYRVMRGGSWSTRTIYTSYRSWYNPVFESNNVGFRCAKDAN